MRATIKMIAERAGVSIGTVDRVLHDRPYVKEEVRRRVLEVMEELDYQPNRVASALATSGRPGISLSSSPRGRAMWARPWPLAWRSSGRTVRTTM